LLNFFVIYSWLHDCAAKTTEFTFSGDTTGWLGLGFIKADKFDSVSSCVQNDCSLGTLYVFERFFLLCVYVFLENCDERRRDLSVYD
jgi:hypothetical protein